MGADQESDFHSLVSIEADAVLESVSEKSGNSLNEYKPILHQFPWWSKWIAAFVCWSTGVFAAYAFKWQNKTFVQQCDDLENEDCRPIPFVGPFLQVLLMFIGEAFCFLIWNVDNLINRSKNRVPWTDFTRSDQSFAKPEGHWWHWALLAFMDFSGSTLNNIANTITYASTTQMLHNTMVIICAFEQLTIIRRALRIHEWIGVVTITTAMVLTALPAILNPETSVTNDGSSAWLGVLFALLSTCCQGTQIMMEEWLFMKSRYGPIKAVGIEGLAGIVMVVIAMPIAQATALDNVRLSFYQFFNSRRLVIITVFYFIACIGFNGGGVATIKLGGGLLRSMLSALRGPSVWILDLITKWITFEYINLVAIFIFLVGFAIHVRCYPPEKFPRMHRFLSKPWHWCCTRPELDEGYMDEDSVNGRATSLVASNKNV
eukprot:Gregarina_sp_Poly_1__9875@NODE_640_length_7000_cov_184_134574_g489_i0_p2_GENE_NODE_640_length_7000_cov_184_134574_g489_i0NODE_640_length_7000_cov_184_134574_g489_i0_p2_ORF_typecomplete_len431_score32_96SLC35F/PF06027_12/1_6e21CRTlike/PF08627_10/2_2e19Nuc_sug_transp/PF04142_15/2e19UAA/PF08449_11/1_4e12PUNUT/PF16913_5/6e12TPT/PF03151_16/3_1e10EamA/PF00892_20/1_8e03EamA/PF00892_20/0_0021EamA/PF00892_20/3_9e02Ferric_reduct/PF01794_19/1_2e03Ferric_reduct/PF01794_19/0_0021Ferric_reduct/PF01794_19/4_6e